MASELVNLKNGVLETSFAFGQCVGKPETWGFGFGLFVVAFLFAHIHTYIHVDLLTVEVDELMS